MNKKSRTRYFIPRFEGEESVSNLTEKIERIVHAFGTHIRINRRFGVITFRLEADQWSQEEAHDAWHRLCESLRRIHRNCTAISYRAGERLDFIYRETDGYPSSDDQS